MKYLKKSILLIFVFHLNIFAADIQITGQAIKLLDIGKRTIYFNNSGESISIHMPKKNHKLITNGMIYSKGGFEFKKNISDKYIGEEFQFKVGNDWFILSPFNGKFFLPKYTSSINIVLISKNSKMYQELFKVVEYYSIQTFVTKSIRTADRQVRNLQRFCVENSGKNAYYCKKYVKKISIIEPNYDPLYKIYYNKYKSYANAKKDLQYIKRLPYLSESFIVQHTNIDIHFFK